MLPTAEISTEFKGKIIPKQKQQFLVYIYIYIYIYI
jgi:hypothetical protein